MAFPQTSYSRSFDAAQSGQLGDSAGFRAEAFLNDEGSDIPAGIAVVLKAAGTADVYDSSGDLVLGVTVLSEAHDPTGLTAPNVIKDKAAMNVLTEGAIWVQVEEAVAVTDAVYVRHTSDGGSNTQLGRFRVSSDSSKAAILKGARWLTAGSAGGCALLYYSRAAQGMA